jgi:MYXO-CTERM domain-containing protein
LCHNRFFLRLPSEVAMKCRPRLAFVQSPIPMAHRLAAVALFSSGLCLLSSRAANAQDLAAGDPRTQFEIRTWVMGLSNLTDVAFLPDGRSVIVRKNGEVIVRNADGTSRRSAAQLMLSSSHNEQGLLGVIAHPDFAQNKTIFLYASVGDTANRHKVLKATVADSGAVTVDLQNPVIDRGLEGPANHNGGGLIIYKNQLYVSVGDTGANATPPRNKYASCLNKPNGKILRVELDGQIPADNPLNDLAMVTGCDNPTGDFRMRPPDKRIYAWGMRNPFRFWVDPTTGLLWVGDVGEATREEVSVGTKGTHFGYPFFEGTVRYQQSWNVGCNGMTPSTNCTPPVFDYQNVRMGTNCVIGGLIPDGCGWPAEFKSRYFFGDHGTGDVWTLDVTPDRRGVVANSRKAFGRVPGLAAFRMGHDASLYLVSHGGDLIAKVTPRNRPSDCTNPSPAPDAGAPADASGPDASGPQAADAGTPDLGTGGATGSGGSGGGGMTGSGTGGTGGTTSGAGGARGGAGGSMGGGSGGAEGDDPGMMPDAKQADGGCGCATSGSPGPGTALFLLVVVGLVARLRRRAGLKAVSPSPR